VVVLLFLGTLLPAPAGRAEEPVMPRLQDALKTLDSANEGVAALAASIDALPLEQLSPVQRKLAPAAFRKAAHSVDAATETAANSGPDLRAYTASVREQGFTPAVHKAMWQQAVSKLTTSCREMETAVAVVSSVVQKHTADRERSTSPVAHKLLSDLGSSDPPQLNEELVAVDQIDARYRALSKGLAGLQQSLTRAATRIETHPHTK
jgi:hypothetical protein